MSGIKINGGTYGDGDDSAPEDFTPIEDVLANQAAEIAELKATLSGPQKPAPNAAAVFDQVNELAVELLTPTFGEQRAKKFSTALRHAFADEFYNGTVETLNVALYKHRKREG